MPLHPIEPPARLRTRHPLRLLMLLLLLALGLGLRPGAALAQGEGPILTVPDVKVDVTGATAALAREEALLEANRQALIQALKLFASDPAAFDQIEVSKREIDQAIVDFSVTEEKASTGRYIGTFTYRLRRDAVERLFRSRGLRQVQASARPLLVVPLLRQPDGSLRVWEDNPALESWGRVGRISGLLPLIAPNGDIDDRTDLTAEQLAAREPARLARIAARYDAGSTLLAELALPADPAQPVAQLKLERWGAGGLERELSLEVDLLPEESPAAFQDRVRDLVAAVVQEDWRRGNDTQSGGAELSVHVPLLSLSDWLGLQDRLGRIGLISRVTVDSVSVTEARLVLAHGGDQPALAQALQAEGLTLSEAPEPRPGRKRQTGWEPAASHGLALGY